MYILASASEICGDLSEVIKLIKLFINLICWSVPILLIVLGSIDMFKAVTTNDEKMASEAKSKLVKRIVYGVLIFLIPFFINLIFEILGGIVTENDGFGDTNSWVSCWNESGSSKKYSSSTSSTKKKKSTSNVKSDSSSQKEKECKYSCNNGGILNMNNECYEYKLDPYYFDGGMADCNKTCESRAIKATYAKKSGDGFVYCDCYYEVTKEC